MFENKSIGDVSTSGFCVCSYRCAAFHIVRQTSASFCSAMDAWLGDDVLCIPFLSIFKVFPVPERMQHGPGIRWNNFEYNQATSMFEAVSGSAGKSK